MVHGVRRQHPVEILAALTDALRGPQGEQLAAAHEARLKTVRATARKARRTAALQTSDAPVPTAAFATPARNR